MNKRIKRQSRWKKEQRARIRNKRSQNLWMGVSFIALIGLLIGLRLAVLEAKRSVWDGKSRFSFIRENNDSFEVVSFSLQEREFKSIFCKKNLMVKTPFGFGEYQLKNVFKLGELEGSGGRLLIRAVEAELGLPVKGFKVAGGTNLSLWDRLRLGWYEKMAVRRKVKLDLLEEGSLSKDYLNDGEEVYRISQVLVDDLVNREFFDEQVVNENFSIGVLNASGVSGVASSVGRLVSNLGGVVSVVGNEDEVESSKILVKDKAVLESYTVERLVEILGIGKKELGETLDQRVEIVIVVGKDYTQLD